MHSHLIDPTEMYVRTVWELQEEGIPPIRARLAERLELSAPSVSETVARLEEDGLLHLEEDRTISLTGQGRALALSVMRKHRLAERLLADVVGLEWEHLHAEACRWEHVISDAVEEKLIELLDRPTTCPHGNPIPGLADDEEVKLLTLTEVPDGEVRLDRISEHLQVDIDAMRVLDQAGIRPGVTFEVEHEPAGVTVSVEGSPVTLDERVASHLYVAAG